MRYETSPHALVELREAFKKAGYYDQERMITYAFRRSHRKLLYKEGGFSNILESRARHLFFELTCDYGMSPGRLLKILATFILFFTIVFTIFLRFQRKDGIWVVWQSDRIRKDKGPNGQYLLEAEGLLKQIGRGFQFSILSAFAIGWRDLNVGNWLTRLQPFEYILRATGWARCFSGIQSILCVYLLALWVITYFGRPFD